MSSSPSNLAQEMTLPVLSALHDVIQRHVFFIHHSDQRDCLSALIANVMTSLTIDFRFATVDSVLAAHPDFSVEQAVQYGMATCLKTAVVLSDNFIEELWPQVSNAVLLRTSGLFGGKIHDDFIAIVCDPLCDVPPELLHVAKFYLDDSNHGWQRFSDLFTTSGENDADGDSAVNQVSSESQCRTITTFQHCMSYSQNGRLLVSLRSRCTPWGQEVIDPDELPVEFFIHSVPIPAEVYSRVMRHVMADVKFRCYVCCHNVSVAITVFMVLLCLCLVLVPLVEGQLMTSLVLGKYRTQFRDDVGMVHAVIVWLCLLCVYTITVHVTRKQMRISLNRRLVSANRCLSEYNLLLGVEDVGLVECNKYYIHFIYYDLARCLEYLQESLDTPPDSQVTDRCELDVDTMTSSTADQCHMFTGYDVITNGAMQTKT